MQHKIHPFADHFPMMDEAAIRRLADSIKRNGQREPIRLRESDNLVVDGRNRLAACELAGVAPETERIPLTELETLDLIADLNIDRRHLTQAQKAEAAAEYARLVESSEKVGHVTDFSGDLPSRGIQSATKAAAAKFGVSQSTVQRARRAIAADPAMAEKIKNGKISAAAAAKAVADNPHEQNGKPKISGGTAFNPAELEREPLKDKNGDPVPESLRRVFGDLKDALQECVTEAKRLEDKTLAIALQKHSRALADVFTPITKSGKDSFEQGDLGMFRHRVRRAMPHAVCPFCRGVDSIKCVIQDPVTGKVLAPCDSRGWMEKETFEKAKKIAK